MLAKHITQQYTFLAILICILFLFGYAVIGMFGWGNPASSEQAIGEVSRWCERVADGIFREPSNALSNIGFMIAGVIMLQTLSGDSTEPKNTTQFHGFTPVSLLYTCAAIWLGAGSLLMHGTHTGWGASADNLGMVMYILIPWLFNVSQMGRWSTNKFLLVYLALVLIYGFGREIAGPRLGINLELFDMSIGLWGVSEVLYRYWSPVFRWVSGFIGFVIASAFGIFPSEIIADPVGHWWVVLFWVPAILSRHRPVGRRIYMPWFVAGVSVYMLAFAIWLTGRPNHPWCNPDSIMQAHAIWHLLSALAIWFFFQFLRTEQRLSP